jgi:hypothetical protein
MIKNVFLPICKECIHFTGTSNPGKFGMNKCKLFGSKDLVSGKIRYEKASACRRSPDKCGNDAIRFDHVNSKKMADSSIEYSKSTILRMNYYDVTDTNYRALLNYPYFDKIITSKYE